MQHESDGCDAPSVTLSRKVLRDGGGEHLSVTFLAGHGEIRPPCMGDPHGDPQTSPQHTDPHGRGAFLKRTIQEIHVDQRVVGWSAGLHVDRPCGGGGEISQ